MGIKLTNNAVTTLATGITASDTTISVLSGTGALFPALSTGDYFYGVLEDASNNYEIVKVTARSTDAMTIVRAQEGTTALAFSAGSAFDLRVTVQTFMDYIQSLVGAASVDSFTGNAGTTYGPLTYTPTSVMQGIVVVGTGVQRPTTDYSYSGNNIVFTSAVPTGVPIMVFLFNPSTTSAGLLKATNNLSDVGSAATARANLGLAIGTDVQAFDANTVKKNVANTFTATQTPAAGTAAVSTTSTFSYDPSTHGQVCTVTLTNATTVTLAVAAGKAVAGTHYTLILKAGDTSARTFAKGATVLAPAATLPITSGTTTSGSWDVLHLVGVDANTMAVVGSAADVR